MLRHFLLGVQKLFLAYQCISISNISKTFSHRDLHNESVQTYISDDKKNLSKSPSTSPSLPLSVSGVPSSVFAFPYYPLDSHRSSKPKTRYHISIPVSWSRFLVPSSATPLSTPVFPCPEIQLLFSDRSSFLVICYCNENWPRNEIYTKQPRRMKESTSAVIHNAILSRVGNIAIPRHRLNNTLPYTSFPIPPSSSLSLNLLFFHLYLRFVLLPSQTSDQPELDPNPVFTRFLQPPVSDGCSGSAWNKVNSSFFAVVECTSVFPFLSTMHVPSADNVTETLE